MLLAVSLAVSGGLIAGGNRILPIYSISLHVSYGG